MIDAIRLVCEAVGLVVLLVMAFVVLGALLDVALTRTEPDDDEPDSRVVEFPRQPRTERPKGGAA